MGFAPESNGEVMPFTYELPDVRAKNLDGKSFHAHYWLPVISGAE